VGEPRDRVNNLGQIVCRADTGTGTDGFLYGNGQLTAIDDNGQIVVNANDTATSQTRTLLLTRADHPAGPRHPFP
jgi:hypothetical protein